MSTCPHCQCTDGQVKVGRNDSGTQRYLCKACRRKYTPEPKAPGYDAQVRCQAVRLYVDGMNLRRIARQLGVVHQTVANWVAAHATTLPGPPPAPPTTAKPPSAVAELDKLSTFDNAKLHHSLAPLGLRSRDFPVHCRRYAMPSSASFLPGTDGNSSAFRHAHPSYPAHISEFVYP